MSSTKSKTLTFRLLMFAFFLAPCLFAFAQAGPEATVARLLSLFLTLGLALIYLGQDFLTALYSDTFTKAVPIPHYLVSVMVLGISTMGLAGMALL